MMKVGTAKTPGSRLQRDLPLGHRVLRLGKGVKVAVSPPRADQRCDCVRGIEFQAAVGASVCVRNIIFMNVRTLGETVR